VADKIPGTDCRATLDAQMNIEKVQLIRNNGSTVNIVVSLGPIFREKEKAVMIAMRNA
jgi:hypothetical protein